MGYNEALQAAGAEVLAYESFGSYQGDWLAKVVFNGETFYVAGAYGSCSGCDSYEATFSYSEDECDEHRYTSSGDTCEACKTAKQEHQTKLAAFGLEYLTDPFTKEELVKRFTKDSEWDHDAKEVLNWLENN